MGEFYNEITLSRQNKRQEIYMPKDLKRKFKFKKSPAFI